MNILPKENLPLRGGALIDGEYAEVAASTQAPVELAPYGGTKIAVFSPTAVALHKLEAEYKGRVYAVTTTEGDKAAREARRMLVSLRVGLEALRKQEKAELLERGRLIDTEAKRITGAIAALEDPIDAQIKAEEFRKAAEKAERDRIEAERVGAIRAKINEMKQYAFDNVGQPSAIIKLAIDVVTDTQITKDEYAEFAVEADTVRGETLVALWRMFGAAEVLEKQQEEVKAQQEAVKREALENRDRAKALEQREKALDVQGEKEPASTTPPPPPNIPTSAPIAMVNCSIGIVLHGFLHQTMPWEFDADTGEMRDARGAMVFESCSKAAGVWLADLSRTLAKQAR
jgi:hypothetical protein